DAEGVRPAGAAGRPVRSRHAAGAAGSAADAAGQGPGDAAADHDERPGRVAARDHSRHARQAVIRVFVYEHVTATCADLPGGGAAPSLVVEGRAMRDAVAADFGRIPGVEVVTFPDAAKKGSGVFFAAKKTPDPFFANFRTLARAADFVLVIAPEFDAILETRV